MYEERLLDRVSVDATFGSLVEVSGIEMEAENRPVAIRDAALAMPIYYLFLVLSQSARLAKQKRLPLWPTARSRTASFNFQLALIKVKCKLV